MTGNSARRGRRSLTPAERQERKDFVLERLKLGFSFLEIQRQFSSKYGYSIESSRKWVRGACAELHDGDIQKRKRIYHAIVEMYHAQIASYQTELLAMQREIDLLKTSIKRRNEILLAMPSSSAVALEQLKAELATVPEPGPLAVAQSIESKTRIRERMCKAIFDLARLQGIGFTSDWKHALNVLLDNGLVPPELAERISQAIDQFEFLH